MLKTYPHELIFFLFFPENRIWHFEMSNSASWEKLEKYFKMLFAEIFTPSLKPWTYPGKMLLIIAASWPVVVIFPKADLASTIACAIFFDLFSSPYFLRILAISTSSIRLTTSAAVGWLGILYKCKIEIKKNKKQQQKNNKHDFKIKHIFNQKVLGPVVQSVVSLTSSLKVISLTVLADSIYNILIFFAEKMWVAFTLQKLLTFFQQKNSAYLRITQCKF